ncbi:hypothetical protein [Kitasatospora sp. HPMI-4]|uniref:hypothetical protein n=1 Tax=Kitasatospora sp. HPMI-4 TaxID=3448443 RepID=UPI003F19F4B5
MTYRPTQFMNTDYGAWADPPERPDADNSEPDDEPEQLADGAQPEQPRPDRLAAQVVGP